MAKLISFEEAIRTGLIKEGDYVNPIDCFQSDNGEVIVKECEGLSILHGPKYFRNGKREVVLTRILTGWKENQTFTREEDLKWVYSKDYQGIPTLFSNSTEFNLYLKGHSGFCNAETILNEIADIYSNEFIGFSARSLKDEDVKFIDNTPILKSFFNENDKKILLPSNFNYCSEMSTGEYGVYYMEDFCIKQYNLSKSMSKHPHSMDWLANSFMHPDYDPFNFNGMCRLHGCFGICIAISLIDTHILVDIESKSRDGEWKLVPAI